MKITWTPERWRRYWEAKGALSVLYQRMGMARAPHGPVWSQYRRRRIALIRAHGLRHDDFVRPIAHRRRLRRGWGRRAWQSF